MANQQASEQLASAQAGVAEEPCSGAPALSIEGICEVFWEIERRHDLLSWTVEGVHPWPLMRMQTYYAMTQKTGLFAPAHPSLKQHFRKTGPGEKLARWIAVEAAANADRNGTSGFWLRRILRAFGRSIDGVAQKPYAILMSTRRVDGSEPYSDALRAEAGDKALLIDRPHVDGTMAGAYDISALQSMFKVKYGSKRRLSLSAVDQDLCASLRGEIGARLGVDPGDLAARIPKLVKPFAAIRAGAEVLFRAHGVRKLFLTHGYGSTNQAFIAGARDAGVRTIELQHGFISKFHLGYSWPGRPIVPYAADELWCFGDFWGETTPLPGNVTTRTIGAPYVKGRAATGAGPRQEDLVVFTSQGVIGDRLFDMCIETARRRPDRRFVFRLHPSEALESYEVRLAQVGEVPRNFELSHRTPNIFTLLGQTGIQVGAFSTTLFEGMSLGTRTIVVDLPGVEYMRPVLERGDAIKVSSIDELAARLDDAPVAASPEVYYADPVFPLL